MKRSVIVSAKRTPMGRFMGSISKMPAPQLGTQVAKVVLDQTKTLDGGIVGIVSVIPGELAVASRDADDTHQNLPETWGRQPVGNLTTEGIHEGSPRGAPKVALDPGQIEVDSTDRIVAACEVAIVLLRVEISESRSGRDRDVLVACSMAVENRKDGCSR